MRLGLMLVGVASMGFGAFAACSSFSANDPEPATDGGAEAASPVDAAAPEAAAVDAALPPTPGSIDCFGTTCSTAGRTACCLELDAGTKSCAINCPAATLTVRCDDRSDCAPNELCCVNFFGDTSCGPTCNGTGERLCHADSECETGSTCVKVPCRGTTIGACGPVGNYVKSFCSVK
jgi:hypothetical protein